MLEADFQAKIMATLGANPKVRIWRQLVGNFYARYMKDGEEIFVPIRVGPPKGAADISGVVCADGRRIEIEVKGSNGKPSPEQIQWGQNMRKWHVVHVFAVYDDAITLEKNVECVVKDVMAQVDRLRE